MSDDTTETVTIAVQQRALRPWLRATLVMAAILTFSIVLHCPEFDWFTVGGVLLTWTLLWAALQNGTLS